MKVFQFDVSKIHNHKNRLVIIWLAVCCFTFLIYVIFDSSFLQSSNDLKWIKIIEPSPPRPCITYTTLVYTSSYIPRVVVLFYSLRKNHGMASCDKIQVLVSETIPEADLKVLAKNNIPYKYIKLLNYGLENKNRLLSFFKKYD